MEWSFPLNLRDVYYDLKPLMPRPLQVVLRRQFAAARRKAAGDRWPIDREVRLAPPSWEGWPDNKKFALVLTHDVETAAGQGKCHELMALERAMGFRSAFYFVPERYDVSSALRRYLADDGFEVGVHGIRHDGKDFKSRRIFERRAPRINRYLKEWQAVGFRAPAMYCKFEWLNELDIEYDASTFDTDPFELGSTAARTIFPFYVNGGPNGKGFVELPYTLPQDFTLFVISQDKNLEVWKRKLDWIAEHGGMALMLTHPDYMNFNGHKSRMDEYPAGFYEQFLDYIRSKYEGQFWNPLPKEMARFWRGQAAGSLKKQTAWSPIHSLFESNGKRERIWIDLDNSPHVPFFRPVVEKLKARGFDVLLTARRCAQVCGLADKFEMDYHLIGQHHGKHKAVKAAGLLVRAAELIPLVLREKPALALSHGSRAQYIAARMLRIPSIQVLDYEHSKHIPLLSTPKYLIVPEVLKDYYARQNSVRFFTYPGIKEDVYVPFFKPDVSILDTLGLSSQDIIITVRPPAVEAHYHRRESEELFEAAVDYLGGLKKVKTVMLPRYDSQQEFIKGKWPELLSGGKMIIPPKVVDGLNLIWFSDLVISGGGTMNREAAALGVPVYSIFRGEMGEVDRYLAANSKLSMITNESELRAKVRIARRDRPQSPENVGQGALDTLVDEVISLAKNGNGV